LTELHGTSRLMREMAQQLRQIVEESLTPITPRMRHLANQLEQYADALETETSMTRH
jgi:hypothetical protein